MNKVIGILLLLLMTNCKSPSIATDPEPISCKGATLVLNSSGMDLPAWERANKDHKYTIKEGRIYVTLSSIAPGYLSAWLYDNNPNIMFELSLEGILCHHFIPDIDNFELGQVKATRTFQQIKDELAENNYPLTDSFQQYVELSFNSSRALELNGSRTFKPTKYYYSMAFFMAVGRVNNFNESTLFTFHKGKYRDNPVIIIEVTGGGYTNYYDFAQYPPLN